MRDAADHHTVGMSSTSLLRRLLGPVQLPDPVGAGALTIRYATEDDADAIARLARLDSSRPPRGVVLLAEVGGELRAAISVDDRHAVADPFRPTGELVWILNERARRLQRARGADTERLPRVWPAVARP